MAFERSPHYAYSITIFSLFCLVAYTQTNLTIKGCFRFLKICASLIVYSLYCQLICSTFTSLTTKSSPVYFFRTKYALPNAPSPSNRSFWYIQFSASKIRTSITVIKSIVIKLQSFDPIQTFQVIQIMKKVKKFIKFQDIELTTTQQHPKDVSRAHLKVIDTFNNNAAYKTFTYGTVTPTSVHWTSAVELPFSGQQSLQFQTVCEHEYGYEIQELKALYSGIIYLKPDQFFFYNTTHCLNQEGVQCGTLKFMIKIVEREQAKKEEKEPPPKEPVKVNLVAKISIYAASLMVNSYYSNVFFKKRKRNLKLQIRYDRETFVGQPKFGELQYKWLINSKFDVNDSSPDVIYITIFEDGELYLQGVLPMATLEQNKRFTVQIVSLSDQNGERVAAIHLDLRYVSKKELLDLMYSPKQLSQNKMERKQQEHYFNHKSRTSSVAGEIGGKKEKKLYEMLHNQSMSKQLSTEKHKHSPFRYKVNLTGDHQQASIPRSRRFDDMKAVNQHVSYIDPSLLSDFSPNRRMKKGATQSSSNKVDFTKNNRGIPGVGEYHLPSIWQKK